MRCRSADRGRVLGRLSGAGALAGIPAVLLQVIHTGDLHRGEYLVLFASPPRMIPIYQFRYEDDDWENRPREVVYGSELRSHHAAFSDSGVFVVGTCSQADRIGCLVHLEATDAPDD